MLATQSPFLSLIIPCYNEENTLETCVQRCLALCEHDVNLELVIVDDCSSDDSLVIAEKLRQDMSSRCTITVLKHEVNQGKGAALRTGFTHAQGDYVAIQDADMEYNPLDYLVLLKEMRENNADVVYGSRYLRPGSRRVLYFWHTWMNRTLTFASNMFTNLDITDMETCYKLFTKKSIQEIAPKLKENRFGFEPEITAYIAQHKLKIHECAITYNPRTHEEGKKIGWKDGVRALYCILHYSAHTAPLPMQILLYFFIGLSAAIANLIAFSGLLAASFSIFNAIILSFIFSALVNYYLCIKILFRHQARWSSFMEIATYALTVIVMCAIDYSVTLGLLSFGMSAIWSKAWASIVGFVGNFLLRKFFVF